MTTNPATRSRACTAAAGIPCMPGTPAGTPYTRPMLFWTCGGHEYYAGQIGNAGHTILFLAMRASRTPQPIVVTGANTREPSLRAVGRGAQEPQ